MGRTTRAAQAVALLLLLAVTWAADAEPKATTGVEMDRRDDENILPEPSIGW